MMSTNIENDLPCPPASPRRLQVPGPASVKYTTDDFTEVAAQASVAVNATGDKPKAKLVQQAFHKSMFLSRPRSSSFGDISQSNSTMDQIQTAPQTNPDWQRVPTLRSNKRRRTSVSPPIEVGPLTNNRFKILSVDAPEPIDHPKAPNKPPPLILYGIEDVTKLTETIESVLDPTDYSFKIITKNQLRVNCKTPEPYKKLMTLVREKGLIGHTFTQKENRCCRIVIRNLHHSTPHEEITKEIESTGNKVVGEIINARIGPEKRPSSTFFVNLESSLNNKNVKDIKYIFHTSVIIEDPRKRKVVPQCTRCQQYGHTKNNCTRPFRCVKCALSHRTSDCPKKDRNTPAKCALCFGSHPANFKGCQVYKEIHNRKFNKTNKQESKSTSNQLHEKAENLTSNPTLPLPNNFQTTNNSVSYADATKGNQQQSTCNKLVEELLAKQSEQFEALLQQISSMMSLIVKLVDKLSH